MTFQNKLNNVIKKNNSFVCIGLDSDLEKLPAKFRKFDIPQFDFNKWIIDQTHDLVCAYKANSAFYEAEGAKGIDGLKKTCDYLRKNYPDIPVILDAKRGDIGSTNEGYLKYAFEYLRADAITLHPYLGQESLEQFLNLKDKSFFILCKTSNPGAGEFQDLKIIPSWNDRTKMVQSTLYQHIASRVAKLWNKNGNCMLVVGATYPKELREIRKIVDNMTLLVPGIGTQGGDVEKTVKGGMNSKKAGLIINSSRGIIFSEDPSKEAQKLRDKINKYR